jgi:hypothetical protein
MSKVTVNRCRLILLGLLAGKLLACGDSLTPPEQALRAWVAEGQRLVEAQDRSGLLELVSDDYADSRGNDRNAISNMFRLYFLRANGIKLLISIEEVRVFGDSAAELDLKIGMASTHDGVLGFSADAYNFELELIRDGSDWLLISGRWGEVGGDMH